LAFFSIFNCYFFPCVVSGFFSIFNCYFFQGNEIGSSLKYSNTLRRLTP
jgi:hypothetical protein